MKNHTEITHELSIIWHQYGLAKTDIESLKNLLIIFTAYKEEIIVLIRLLFFLFVFVSTANSQSFCFDESDHDFSHMTKNDMGKSSYHCTSSGNLLQILLDGNLINTRDAVLDFGAGYGCVTYELSNLGFTDITASDIAAENLQCLRQHQNRHLFGHKPDIRLMEGDILHEGQYESMSNDSLGLVYARNVIHLMEANDIIRLLKISHQKLKNEGMIIFEYENNRQDELSWMIDMISRDINENFHASHVKNQELKTVKKYYEESGCSFDDYLKVNPAYRSPGFPCQFHSFLKTNKRPFMYQYIDQKRFIELLTKLKFKVLHVATLDNKDGTVFVLAQKEF